MEITKTKITEMSQIFDLYKSYYYYYYYYYVDDDENDFKKMLRMFNFIRNVTNAIRVNFLTKYLKKVTSRTYFCY